MIKRYIQILELPKNFKELPKDEQLSIAKSCFYKYARKWHPDVNKSPEAPSKFKAGRTAYEQLTELIQNGTIKDSSTFKNKKEHNSYSYSSYNADDEFSKSINELLKEFEQRINKKWKIQKEQTKQTILKILGILFIAFVVALGVLKIPFIFTVFAVADFFVRKCKKAY